MTAHKWGLGRNSCIENVKAHPEMDGRDDSVQSVMA